ncbi:MAG TPA: tail fiber domain-containing protein [Chthoniobacterales bacterium]|jgi:hypothetical protein
MKTSRASVLSLVAALVLPSAVLAVEPPPGVGYANDNTALGDEALSPDDPPPDNTALGYQALYGNAGAENTAVGSHALAGSATGSGDVAVGFQALLSNTSGNYNIAIGNNAMVSNTKGVGNVAIGYTALENGTTASDNVACGFGAMVFNSTGDSDTAIGNDAMANSSGSENTAVGDEAMNGANGSNNTAVGGFAGLNFAGNGNIALGYFSGEKVTNGSNNIEIGNQGAKSDANYIRIGDIKTQKKTFIAGINGVTVSSGVAVVVDKMGQLGVATSSARFKDDIKPMKDASDVLLSLQPVTFRYKKELDSLGTPQFGLVAEQVAKVDPDLVARDESGQPYTVRYEAVNAMLLNEFLKEHRKVEQLEATVSELKAEAAREASLEATVGELKAALKQQAAQIQTVSAREEDGRTASRLTSANE